MVFLKSIEAKGFKSFADKTSIKFNTGITAVVGPNGSGKSNIIDAVRFVLGETSARSFRGSKMEDVIFNGTTERKSQNSAVVELNLDNRQRYLDIDKDDISIKRELFRSGESNYYINNERMKLKDITELFMDSGLGKHAYNIISQGEVDTILNQKPEKRREIIEEVAGVMKYKTRKKESERKLDDTLLNLSRIHDITSELESRVTKLEKESAVAKEYLALVEEMKQSDIEVSVYDIKNLSNTLESLNKKYLNDKRTIEEARNHVNLLDISINNYRDKRERLTIKERENNESYIQLSREQEQIIGKIELSKERHTSRSERHTSLLNEKDNKLKDKKELETRFKEIETSLEESKENLDHLNDEIKSVQESLKSLNTSHDTDVETLKDEYYARMVEKTSLENQLKDYTQREVKDSRKREDLLNRLNEFNDTLKTLETKESQLNETLNTLNTNLTDKRDVFKQLLESLNEKKAHANSLNDKYDKAHRYISQLSSKRDMYNSMMANYEGYYRGVKAVLKRKNKMPGILGAVIELIQIDESFITALDRALGGQSQSIVTKSESDAKRAISYLKDKNLGFATFLPLDTIQKRDLSEEIKYKLSNTSVNHYILKDLIETEYEALLNHLFNTTIIVDNYDDGLKLSRELNFRGRIVTKSGEIFNPGGAVSGGSRQSGNSALKLRKEKEALDEKIKAYTLETNRLKEEKDELTHTIQTLESKLEEEETLGTSLKEEYDETVKLLEQNKNEKSLTTERIALLNNELESIGGVLSYSSLEKEIDDKTKELDALQEKITLLSKEKGDIESLEKEYEENRQKLLERRVALESNIRYEKENLKDYNERINNVSLDIKDIDERIELLDSNYESIDIDALNSRLDEISETLETLGQTSRTLKDEIETVTKTSTEDMNLRQVHLETIETLSETLRETHGEKERTESLLSIKLDYLSETYEITFEKASEIYTDLSNIENKRERIHLNKKSIEELGNVNLNAIEEFETVNERYTFLKREEEDLLEARETLLKVIKEMDYEVSKRFKETFNEVNEQFKQVFKTMFGGGEAELRLTEDGDYLNAGLLIYAEPPGKKLTNMSLLSGGERALTAISLLFSILEVRSSPFIILDEVEAALDEANVLRFSHYLRNLTSYSQCIVITHRKKTMEQSDRLFGITMQEKGVSELISVDLKTYKEREIEGEY